MIWLLNNPTDTHLVSSKKRMSPHILREAAAPVRGPLAEIPALETVWSRSGEVVRAFYILNEPCVRGTCW